MPSEIITSSTQLLSPLEIKGAKPDPVTNEVNVQRMSMAIAMKLGIWYGDKLNAVSDEIAADSAQLSEMSDAMKTWDTSNWSANYAARNQDLIEWGIDIPSPDHARVEGTSIAMTGSTVNAYVVYPAIRLPVQIGFVGANATTMTLVGSGQVVPIEHDVLYESMEGVLFFRTQNQNFTMTPTQKGSLIPVRQSPLTEAEMDELKEEIQQAAENKSQAAMPKQVMMNEILYRRTMFMDWCSKLIKVDEQKENIVGRF